MKSFLYGSIAVVCGLTAALAVSSCSSVATRQNDNLSECLDSLVAGSKGTVGIAVITSDGDTVTAGDSDIYPLMSVFKLPEALAVARVLDRSNISLDTVITIRQADLSPDTWSPMIKDYPEGDLTLSVGRLIEYMLIHSDNNASNILFDRIVSVAETDSIVSRWNIPGSFSLAYTERQMQADHDLSYRNTSSPLACAALINRVFTDSLVSADKQSAIRELLGRCSSAPGRIAAAVAEIPGAKLYHRTGSGYTNERGEICAVNDVAYIELTDGRSIALAVLTKDFPGRQEDADARIAEICRSILSRLQHSGGADGYKKDR